MDRMDLLIAAHAQVEAPVLITSSAAGPIEYQGVSSRGGYSTE